MVVDTGGLGAQNQAIEMFDPLFERSPSQLHFQHLFLVSDLCFLFILLFVPFEFLLRLGFGLSIKLTTKSLDLHTVPFK